MSSSETASIDMYAPAEVVFDFLTDPGKLEAWAGETVKVQLPSDAPLSEGAHFRESVRDGKRTADFTGEVVACDRPRHFATRLRGADYTMELDLRMHDASGWTHVEMRSTVAEAKPMARLLGAIFGWSTHRTLERRLWLLKRAVEDGRDVT